MKSEEKQIYKNSIAFMFLIYWLVLVIWQNLGKVTAKTSIDAILKLLLLIYFVITYIKKSRKVNYKIFFAFFLAGMFAITAVNEKSFSINSLISYVYPIIFIIMVYGFGDKIEINKKQLLMFCNCIIGVVLYTVIYSFIFCFDEFIQALTAANAYGNEFSSFFISGHEYGMYLASGIISCLICLRLYEKISKRKKIFYIVSLILFSINLIVTFSRTSIVAVIIFFIIYCIFDNGKLKRRISLLAFVTLIICITTPTISNFISNIVFKKNNLAGRDELYINAIEFYKESPTFKKVFGHGINETQSYLLRNLGHTSVHNGYLQILLTYGIIPLMLLIFFMVVQVITSIRTMKKNRFMGTIFLGLVLMSMMVMFTNTSIIFTSSIDSYFLTIFAIVVPKYIKNSINNNNFDD